MCHLKVRSLTAVEVSLLVKNTFDITAVTETWLNDGIPHKAISLRNY